MGETKNTRLLRHYSVLGHTWNNLYACPLIGKFTRNKQISTTCGKMQIFLNVVHMITVGIMGIILTCVTKSCRINSSVPPTTEWLKTRMCVWPSSVTVRCLCLWPASDTLRCLWPPSDILRCLWPPSGTVRSLCLCPPSDTVRCLCLWPPSDALRCLWPPSDILRCLWPPSGTVRSLCLWPSSGTVRSLCLWPDSGTYEVCVCGLLRVTLPTFAYVCGLRKPQLFRTKIATLLATVWSWDILNVNRSANHYTVIFVQKVEWLWMGDELEDEGQRIWTCSYKWSSFRRIPCCI